MKYYKKNRREIIKRNVICNRLRNIRNKAVLDLSGMKLKRGRPKKVYDLEEKVRKQKEESNLLEKNKEVTFTKYQGKTQ